MKTIPLTQGKYTVVDDSDFELLSAHEWCAGQNHRGHWYAIRTVRREGGRTTERMHRVILGLASDDPRQVDHKDGNGLNNARTNLRITDHMGNARNCKIPRHNTSGYKGVSWDRSHKKFRACIRVNGRRINLGRYDDPIGAARAYDRAALKYHGEFARINKC